MNAIWKFPLTEEETEIEAPIEQFLTVQMQGNTPCVWAIVNPNRAPKKYKVYVLGTGWECQKIDASRYIGTVQDGAYVWHCFWENTPAQRYANVPAFAMFSSRTSVKEQPSLV